MQRAKRTTGCWSVVTTTESPPACSDQFAGGAHGGSSDCLRDAQGLHEVGVMKTYRPRLLREGSTAATIRHVAFYFLGRMGGMFAATTSR